MSEIRANSITDAAGTGAPNFPNGLEIAGEATLSAIASQAQAEAGTDNTTVMTPLRAAQAIGALVPPAESYTLLGTLATTSGTLVTLSGLTLTDYSQVFCVMNGVSFNVDGASLNLQDTPASGVAIGGTAGQVIRGVFWIDLATGVFSSSYVRISTITPNSFTSDGRAGICSVTNASTSISFGRSSGSFDAGSILIYGVK
jgi:hypothetical protein